MKNKLKLLLTSTDYYNLGWVLLLIGFLVGSACKIFLALEFLLPFISIFSLILWLGAGLCFWMSHRKRYKGGAFTLDEAYAIAERYVREYSKDRHNEKAELAAALRVIVDARKYTPILDDACITKATESVTKLEESDNLANKESGDENNESD